MVGDGIFFIYYRFVLEGLTFVAGDGSRCLEGVDLQWSIKSLKKEKDKKEKKRKEKKRDAPTRERTLGIKKKLNMRLVTLIPYYNWWNITLILYIIMGLYGPKI